MTQPRQAVRGQKTEAAVASLAQPHFVFRDSHVARHACRQVTLAQANSRHRLRLQQKAPRFGFLKEILQGSQLVENANSLRFSGREGLPVGLLDLAERACDFREERRLVDSRHTSPEEGPIVMSDFA